MKIMICGSMAFALRMKEVQAELKKLGHTVFLPCDIDTHLSDSGLVEDLDASHKACQTDDTIRKCYDLLAKSDGILVLNLNKNGVEGYIGISTLMEIGLAYCLGKKIFLFNQLPSYHEARWAHEVSIMKPVILDGDFARIK